MISISKLAKMFKTTVRTLRYYEEIGLIEKSIRLKGKRHYKQETVIARLEKIFFLKSLNLKLSDIKLILNDPLYIKPLIVNIRLEMIRVEIDNLNKELEKLKEDLNEFNWKEVQIDSNLFLKYAKKEYYKLQNLNYLKKKDIPKNISKEYADTFTNLFKRWHKKVGIQLTEEHIWLIAFHPKIEFKEKRIKKVFQKLFKED